LNNSRQRSKWFNSSINSRSIIGDTLVSVRGTISEKTRNKVAIIYTLLRGHPGAPVSVSSKVPQGFCPTIDLELFNLHYPKLSLDFVEHTTE